MPFTTAVLEVAHELLLLGVHGDDRLAFGLRRPNALIDVLKLSVAVGMGAALAGFDIGLQAVALAGEQFADQLMTGAKTARLEFIGKVAHALGSPAQRVLLRWTPFSGQS